MAGMNEDLELIRRSGVTRADRRAAWQRIVSNWQESGVSASAFARQYQLRLKALLRWRDRLLTPVVQRQPSFLEVQAPALVEDSAIELHAGALRVRVHNGCAAGLLHTLIAALREGSC